MGLPPVFYDSQKFITAQGKEFCQNKISKSDKKTKEHRNPG
jgi:hypothetical protein